MNHDFMGNQISGSAIGEIGDEGYERHAAVMKQAASAQLPPRRDIMGAVERLDAETTKLDNIVNELQARLRPAMSLPASAAVGVVPSEIPAGKCEVSQAIGLQIAKVRELNELLACVIATLEI